MEIDDEEQASSSVSFPLCNSVLSVVENVRPKILNHGEHCVTQRRHPEAIFRAVGASPAVAARLGCYGRKSQL
jgi:hypothetical protein